MKSIAGLFLSLSFVLFLSSCNNDDVKLIAYTGNTQGTYYRISYYCADTLVSREKIESLLADFDNSVSVYNPNSLITKLNAEGSVKADEYFLHTWNIAREVSELTDGFFDCTVGPLVEAWGFSFKERTLMDTTIADSLKKLVDYRKVKVNGDQVSFEIPQMHLDFNAVAQGYSVDVVASLLEQHGIKNYLVDIGGEVKAGGMKPGEKPWRVGIEKPNDNAAYGEYMQAVVRVTDKSMATSGNYRKFYIRDGVKYSHTINPRTGYPVSHSLLSATVITDSCGYADAWATAMMVLGPEEAVLLCERSPFLELFLVFSDENGDLKTWASEGFEKMIELD